MDTQSQAQCRADSDGAVRLHGIVRRFGRWVANRCGLLIVTPERVLEWTRYSTEYNRVAGDYETSDEYLCGKNDGRSQSLLRCCQDVRLLNTPNNELKNAGH